MFELSDILNIEAKVYNTSDQINAHKNMQDRKVKKKRPSTLNALWNIFIFKDLRDNFSLGLKSLHLRNNTSTFFLHAYIQKFIKQLFNSSIKLVSEWVLLSRVLGPTDHITLITGHSGDKYFQTIICIEANNYIKFPNKLEKYTKNTKNHNTNCS